MTPEDHVLGPDDEIPKRHGPEIMLRTIDWDRPAKCRSCGARIWWARTQKNGKLIPLNGNARLVARPLAGAGFAISSDHVHFSTCPHAKEHRRDSRTAPSERID